MKKALTLIISLVAMVVMAQLPIGTVRQNVVTDQNGTIINNPLVFSNQVVMLVPATQTNQLVRFQELTNSVLAATAITNIYNIGAGTGLVYSSVSGSHVAQFATLLPGNGITFTNSGNTNITIYATATGGSAAAAVTNANNFFTSGSFNTFNGPTLMVGSQTNSGPLVLNSTLNGMTPANLMTNLTSSTATITGQGTHTLNIEVASSGQMTTNTINVVTDNAFGVSGTWTNFGKLTITDTLSATNFQAKIIRGNGSVPVFTLSSDDGVWNYVNGNKMIEQANTGAGGFDVNNGSGTFIARIGRGDTQFRDSASASSVYVENRSLDYGNNQRSLQWYSGAPGGLLNGPWTNAGSMFIMTNLTVGGTINGLTSGTIVTNITGSGSAVITGQGTSVLNVDVSGTGASALTNRSNLFTFGSTNTFQAPMFTSNIFVNTSIAVNSNTWVQTDDQVFIARRVPGVSSISAQLEDGGGGALWKFGDYAGGGARGAIGTDGSGSVKILGTGSGFVDAYFALLGVNIMRASSSSITLGAAYGNSITLNAGSMTIPSPGLSIGSGALWWPQSTSLIATNGFSTNQFLGTIIANGSLISTNVTVTTPNLIATINTGTATNLIETVNGGAGVKETRAMFLFQTNTLTTALPQQGVWYTNNLDRLELNIQVNLPATATDPTSAEIWSTWNGFTNFQGQVSSEKGVATSVVGTMVARIQPGALYMVTNINTAGGTPTLVQGKWNEFRE